VDKSRLDSVAARGAAFVSPRVVHVLHEAPQSLEAALAALIA
jgi:hypothetical protein